MKQRAGPSRSLSQPNQESSGAPSLPGAVQILGLSGEAGSRIQWNLVLVT